MRKLEMGKVIRDKLVEYLQGKALKEHRIKISKKDLTQILLCRLNDNFEPMFSTRLYQDHGGDYCRILALVEAYLNVEATRRQIQKLLEQAEEEAAIEAHIATTLP